MLSISEEFASDKFAQTLNAGKRAHREPDVRKIAVQVNPIHKNSLK